MSNNGRPDTIYRVFEVSCGWVAAARNRKGICALILPVSSRVRAEEEIRARIPVTAEIRKTALRDVVTAVRRYFRGWRTEFDDLRLNLTAGTAFQQRVWTIIRKIPYGEVRTYRWIGLGLGRPDAVRAIGGAVGANPIPLIIPCHRIVNADARLGGFSAAGGVELKRRMLELERVPMSGEGPGTRILAAR